MTAFSSIMVRVHDPIKWSNYSVAAAAPIKINPNIFYTDDYDHVTIVTEPGDHSIFWQTTASPEFYMGIEEQFYNYNYRQHFTGIKEAMDRNRYGMLSISRIQHATEADGKSVQIRRQYYPEDDPRTEFFYPVFESFKEGSPIVAHLYGVISWSKYFANVLLKKDQGIYCVLSNTCNSTYTWLVSAAGTKFLGEVSEMMTMMM
jgi:hypothetical protein